MLHGVADIRGNLMILVIVAHESDDDPVFVVKIDVFLGGQLAGKSFGPTVRLDQVAFFISLNY